MQILNWIPALAVAALIFVTSHQSRPPGIELTDVIPDWVLHIAAYGVLGLCMVWGSTQGLSRRLSGRAALFVIGAATLYGLGDEWHQSFIAGRTASWVDWLADALGAAAFTLAWLLIQGWLLQMLHGKKPRP